MNWWRYVDDIIAPLENKKQANALLRFINEQHPNIWFTIEHETKNRLLFLDTDVVRRASY